MSRRLERLLYASNIFGRFAIRDEQFLDLFSAKAVCSQEPLRDASLASHALQITLAPPSTGGPFLDDVICEHIAEEFQPKLLQYRLTNFGSTRSPKIDVGKLTPPVQDLARALGTCVADDEDLQFGVVRLLIENDQSICTDPTVELRSVILEGLLFCCHDEGRSHVLCGELADIVNTIWTERGEGRQTKPESVGWKLRELDLRTEPINGAGKGLRLTDAVRARIHSLAQAYQVPSLQRAVQTGCPHCSAGLGGK